MKKVILSVGMWIMSFVCSQPAWADEASQLDNLQKQIEQMQQNYESRINELQTQVNELKEAQKTSTSSMEEVEEKVERVEEKTAGLTYEGRYEGAFEKGGLVAHDVAGFGDVTVGGYMDIEFENFQKTTSTFDQHRFVINIGAELGERLRFYSEYEIEHGGTDAQGVGESKIEQAWVDFLAWKPLNFRAGELLVPFGRFNMYHDSDLQDLVERPLMARRVIPATWTESGAGFHGEFNPRLGSYEDLNIGYEAYFINGLNSGVSDSGFRSARGSIETDNNNNKAIVSRWVLSPSIGHELGLSGYAGDFTSEDDNILGGGVDFLTTWGPLEVLGDYAMFSVGDPTNERGVVTDTADNLRGGYLQANYHFWFDALSDTVLGRSFENPTFTLVGRFDWADLDDDSDTATSKDNQEHRWTLGLNYRPVESWVFKLEYQNNTTSKESLERGDNEGFLAGVAMGF